jgi:hypothetical protein
VGKALMSKMGWKEGQGTGRRLRQKHTAVALPPGIDPASVPASALDGGTVTFAPANTKELIPIPEPKSDYFGIGFTPALSSTYGRSQGFSDSVSDVYRMDDATNNAKGGPQGSIHRAIHRAASGFAIDDDADDIYDADASPFAAITKGENTSSSSRLEEVNADEFDGDDGDRDAIDRRKKLKLSEALDSYLKSTGEADKGGRGGGSDAVNRSLEGFVLALSIQEKPSTYPSIVVPSDFKPFHTFSEDMSSTKSSRESNRNRPSLHERTRMLSESTNDGTVAEAKDSETLVDSKSSVFAMLSEQSREKIRVALQQRPGETSAQPAPQDAAAPSSFRPMLTKSNVAVSVFSGVSAAFKNRFTSATIGDRTEQRKESVEVPSEGLWSVDYQGDRKPPIVTDVREAVHVASVSAAPPAVPLTPKRALAPRLTVAWSPHPLLCKRMNIPVPDASKHIPHYGQEGSQAGPAPALSREEDIFRQHIGQHLSGHPEFQLPTLAPAPLPGAFRDDVAEVRPEKPPISLFKSIFESNTSDSDTDESEVEESSSNCASPVPQPPKIIGPSKPSDGGGGGDLQRLSERPITEPMDEVVESKPAVGRIVFKKPVPKTGILTFESAKSGRRFREQGPAFETSGSSSIGKTSKALSFMDEFEDDEPFEDRDSVALPSGEPLALSHIQVDDQPADSSLRPSIAIAALPTPHAPLSYPVSHTPSVIPDDSSASSTSSSDSSDSESDQSEKRQSSRHLQPNTGAILAVEAENIARFHEKLSSLIDAESRSKKEHRKKEKKSKKEKKEKKKKKDSKKDRKHRDESKRDRKSKKDHKRRE